MKTITAFLALTFLTSTAHADEVDDTLFELGRAMTSQRTNRLDPADCTVMLAKLRSMNAPAARTVTVDEDTPFLRKGQHALPAVRKACDALEYAGKLDEAKRTIRLAIEMKSASGCVKYWPKLIAAGVKPTERMEEDVTGLYGRGKIRVSGTLEELKAKYCDQVVADAQAKDDAFIAPFKKVLKNDKLAVMLDYRGAGGITLAGGDQSMKPAKLAAARAWFATHTGGTCTDGRTMIVVTRYDFDGAHKLVKQTGKQHCGEAVYQ
ncbi:MAG: hypothetical protein M4D80_31360 [Myxococcota bacterium]|nr:hypothetical protein [Deltaproteobacteria bacterium]MDQ3339688.1 hypothetical protein [Myxococcota bacterium]